MHGPSMHGIIVISASELTASTGIGILAGGEWAISVQESRILIENEH